MIDRRIAKVKLRRGTDIERKKIIFDEGEFIYVIDKKRIYVGDGKTYGGVAVTSKNHIVISQEIPSTAVKGDFLFNKSSNPPEVYLLDDDGNNGPLSAIKVTQNSGINDCCADLNQEFDDLLTSYNLLSAEVEKLKPFTTPFRFRVNPPIETPVNEGDDAEFFAEAEGDFPSNITYAWYKRSTGQEVGTKQKRLILPSVSISNIDHYFCVAYSTTFSPITSNVSLLVVKSNSLLGESSGGSPFYILTDGPTVADRYYLDYNKVDYAVPYIVKQPKSQIVTSFTPLTCTVEADGSVPLSYQWFQNGIAIAGANSSSYVMNRPAANVFLKCRVSNNGGSVDSENAKITVYIPPTINIQPVTKNVSKGGTITLSTEAIGSAPLSYHWYYRKNSSQPFTTIVNATNSTYTKENSTLDDEGEYYCEVSNIAGVVNSSIVKVNVKDVYLRQITINSDINNLSLSNYIKYTISGSKWDGVLPVELTLIVDSGITIGSVDSVTPAFTVEKFPSGSVIDIINNGFIQGAGGIGGAGGANDTVGEKGGDGGIALLLNNQVSITNNGRILGGGGGGGGGASGGGGGGGAGALPGYGGGASSSFFNRPGATVGTSGSKFDGGLGGNPPQAFTTTTGGGYGGNGGNAGFNGLNGENKVLGRTTISGGIGGLAGYYIYGNIYAKWNLRGELKGRVN